MKKLVGLAMIALVSLMLVTGLNSATASDKNKDEIFIGKTIINANFEVKASKLALKKSKNPQLRLFAQQIIDGHGKMNNDLQNLLDQKNIGSMISFQELDDEHQKKLEDLGKSSSKDFDEDYTDSQIIEHDETITLFEDYVSEGKNPFLKDFANGQLPMLYDHEKAIKKIEATL